MKITRTLFLFSCIILLSAVSCKKDEPVAELSVNTTFVNVGSSQSKTPIKVKSNTHWTVSADVEWISLYPSEGEGDKEVSVTVKDNKAAAGARALERKGTVIFRAGSKEVSLSVTQVGEQLIFTTPDSEISVPKAGAQVQVQLERNVSYRVEIPSDASSWIKQLSTKAPVTDILHFEIAANNSGSFRTGRISLVPDGSAALYITINQADAPCILNESDLRSFLDTVTVNARLTIPVLEDITVTAPLPVGKGFSGTLEGNNHVIKGWKSSAPLFATNNGTIKDLVIDNSCSFTPEDLVFAPFVRENNGTLDNLTNNGQIAFRTVIDKPVCFGGIAAISRGSIINCTNKGAVVARTEESISGAAAVAGIVGYAACPVKSCVNEGRVELTALSVPEKEAFLDISEATPAVGGISAYGAPGFSMSGCENKGNVVFALTGAEKEMTREIERTQIGGLAGAPCGPVEDCVNNGNIDVSVSNSAKGTTLPYAYIVLVGGIGGGDWLFTVKGSVNVNSSYKSCINNGTIYLYTDANLSNSAVGGIVAWPGQEAAHDKSTVGCTNNGKIAVSGVGKVRAGGIQGGTGNVENCINKGEVVVNSADKTSAAGGICAFHSQGHIIKDCKNYGNVTSKLDLEGGVAGLIGNLGNAKTSSGEGCVVECTVENNTTSQSYTGMVIGKYNGTSNATTLGTGQNPIIVEGMLILGEKRIQISKNNVETYKEGTANATAAHVLYVKSNTESTEYAEGYVKYSDGSPAAGVAVSDGFSTAVTDADGHYKLFVSSDTWYIFFSYPSDAKIGRNANGLPDFFKKYQSYQKTYDFTFDRQSVENEFYIFGMADPQSHYQARSPQKYADTDRFRDEAVPGINSEIAKKTLPCYGITLGDIVYSENSRNSNPGMTVMRDHFKKVNMPVFQVMGNHDYKFFKTDAAIAPTQGRSTINLVAQSTFEDCFGPVNYSFNRGKVHFVCMKDINYTSTTKWSWSAYSGGFTDDQYQWLVSDLECVPKDMKVVLCVHIPMFSSTSGRNVKNALTLISKFTNSEIISGHSHYYRSTTVSGMREYNLNAVCGQWWWSKIEGDGCPNGYDVFKFSGTDIKDFYLIGFNDKMNTRDYQMRIYRGDITTGGSYAWFKWPHSTSTYLINVFAGDDRWKIHVYEDGVLKGDAKLMANKKITFSSVSSGKTYTVDASSNQDWWAIGYHIGSAGRGTSSTSYYTNMFHMWKYEATNPGAKISVEAVDPYGNTYTCDEVITNGTAYPDYIKIALN